MTISPAAIDTSAVREVTCSAPVNIAVIKYWGKRDEALLLPTNSSLSLTLNQDHLQSKTTIRILPENIGTEKDRIWLNGKEELVSAKRLANVLNEVRRLRRVKEALDNKLPRLADHSLHIASVNNFPTAAGLASSASGFACLTFALSQLFELNMPREDVSRLARVGSGSACRSLMGGFVAWDMGSRTDGDDSQARQVATETHWPEMRALILVASDEKKDTGSTEGMQLTVQTAPLLQNRIKHVVPERMATMEDAIARRDFDAFAECTTKDSNEFHAVCLDTFPPIFYLTDVSRAVIALITAYNNVARKLDETEGRKPVRKFRVAYTFDAGPNAVLYLLEKDVPEVMRLINAHFPAPASVNACGVANEEFYGRAMDVLDKPVSAEESARQEKLERLIRERGGLAARVNPDNCLHRWIYTSVGDGPRVLASSYKSDVSLLGGDGMPKVIASSKRGASSELQTPTGTHSPKKPHPSASN